MRSFGGSAVGARIIRTSMAALDHRLRRATEHPGKEQQEQEQHDSADAVTDSGQTSGGAGRGGEAQRE